MVGKRLGLEDTRGTLFYDFARIVDECKPRVFIYENVKVYRLSRGVSYFFVLNGTLWDKIEKCTV